MIFHRARDKIIIKEYSYSQHLCCDCSTIEGESELAATVVSHTQWYPNTVAITNPILLLYTSAVMQDLTVEQPSPTEQISTQPPIQRLSSNIFNQQPTIYRTTAHHALHHLCLVSEHTILYFTAYVSLPQPWVAFPS